MESQRTFADVEAASVTRQTRRARFLQRMEGLVPWQRLAARIRPVYPTGAGGRPAFPLEVMLRIHCVQLFYYLSDPATEDALGDSLAVQRFVGLTGRDPRPDETTILNFRHLLEQQGMGEVLLAEITQHLAAQGVRLQAGTIVDATIIDAPASTKNRQRRRDPAMHQVKKGNQWYFGLKAHIGVDAATGLVHRVVTTPANVADVTQVAGLLHGGETQVWGDAGYAGVARRPEHQGRAIGWQVALRPGQRRRLPPGSAAAAAEQRKASVRAKVEHPFLYVKRHFGYAKARDRGLANNHHRLCWLFGLARICCGPRGSCLPDVGALRPARGRRRPQAPGSAAPTARPGLPSPETAPSACSSVPTLPSSELS